MGAAFPGESAEYRVARDRLLEREVQLRRAMEAVAAARRELPPGGPVPEDYVFRGAGPDGNPADVRMSELFEPGKDSLVIYSFMFPRDSRDDRPGPTAGKTAELPLAEEPCPSCVALLDQLDPAIGHAGQKINFAVGQDVLGGQIPILNVFHRHGDEIRHFWATELMWAPADPGQHPRHVGTLEPIWNLFDLTPEGRPSDWDEQLRYE
jgi:predicted dithiol-disulfide oxidoreductase (DUF899 family)